jgi:vacuolar protein sorting-associated protein 35
MAAPAPVEEGKMLGEALGTVKIQVQQMKRYLVRLKLIDVTFTSCEWL